MNNLIILLEQTKSGATIEILTLLVIAAIIGFITAYIYYRSIYSKDLQSIEFEMDEIKEDVVNLNVDKSSLIKSIQNKDIEIEQLKMEIIALKGVHAEEVRETNELVSKNLRNSNGLHEKDESLMHIAQRKHLLDYKSFGTASESEKDDLKMISGIGPFIEERLHALDIYTFSQISKFSTKDIDTINDAIEYFSGRIERDEWVAQAKELYHNKDNWNELLKRIRERKERIYYNRIGVARKEDADDLTIISGIGGWIKEKLHVLDIYTFKQISNFNNEDVQVVTDVIEYFPGRIERDEWIEQAKELVRIAGKKSELLKRIRERKGMIYYDRLGIAHKHYANNLTLIKGIGLWMEERLNTLEIYTFEQISKFTTSDKDTITDILEISHGRIERDNWVGQAKELAKKKLPHAVVI
jgi:predicted flap endonuclease-1-like 5' DNA nuclease